MKRAVLIRVNQDEKQTIGRLYLYKGFDDLFNCRTLELPFKANIRSISCIPPGHYQVETRISKAYGEHYIVKNVPGRTYILIHVANYYTDLRGCIGVGKEFADINKDKHQDITHSRDTLKTLLKHAPDGFSLTIIDAV